eukprot:CAMPEP_0202490580 /NCGR_PEP_ID=MMETSP1361-20130828/7943_1 /ASSEMBLY_ACC=CAM_ASM_000849 /TAXON_ID=210615 /ORGANISM="Staurosira complex sp., Strain CCMP2646" /LENGTH=63 /DNA_ID=CAMNT_0049120491 /DNA_START=420 /DNA_END=611 /DNA_ORIENTATION=-
MTAGQQFLADSAERSMMFRMKIGEMALQCSEHLMSEYVTFPSTLLALIELQAADKKDMRGYAL